MPVPKSAVPSSVFAFAASKPTAFNCAFQTATCVCPCIEDPAGNALKLVSPGAAPAIRSLLTVE